jgi:hypothetical protein
VVVGVRRDHVRASRAHLRVRAVVAAEIPDEARRHRLRSLAHERGLPLRVLVAVVPGLRIVAPRRARPVPLEAVDEPAQLARVRDDELLPEPRTLELRLHLARSRRVSPLQPRVQHDVGGHAPAETVANREQVAHLARRDAVQRSPEPRLERDVLPRRQHQRVELELAELTVALPRRPIAVALNEPTSVMSRTRAIPLDVVRRGVLQDPNPPEARREQVRLQHCGPQASGLLGGGARRDPPHGGWRGPLGRGKWGLLRGHVVDHSPAVRQPVRASLRPRPLRPRWAASSAHQTRSLPGSRNSYSRAAVGRRLARRPLRTGRTPASCRCGFAVTAAAAVPSRSSRNHAGRIEYARMLRAR